MNAQTVQGGPSNERSCDTCGYDEGTENGETQCTNTEVACGTYYQGWKPKTPDTLPRPSKKKEQEEG